MPGSKVSQECRQEVAGSSLRWIPIGLVAIKMCGVVEAVYGGPTTERSLGSIRKEKKIPSLFWVSILSPYDPSC